MRKYRVNVNGTNYDIAVELISESEAMSAQSTAPAPAAPAAAATAPAAPAPAATAGGEKVESPMPGNILAVNVAVGDTVSEGQVIMILEAMKMENEIMAPKAGRIASISVSKGAVVETGSLLCVIE